VSSFSLLKRWAIFLRVVLRKSAQSITCSTFHSGGMAANVSTKSDLYAISPDVQSDTRSAKSRNREEEVFSPSPGFFDRFVQFPGLQ